MYSLEDITNYVSSHKPPGVIVDTNILLLYLIGTCDKKLIGSCDLVQKYSIENFELLNEVIDRFRKAIITPQIIAEVSNCSITNGIKGDKHLPYIRAVIDYLKKAIEHHQEAKCLWEMELKNIGRFGLTDMTLFALAKNHNIPLLTDDLDLYNYFLLNKLAVVNFSHIRLQPLQSVFSRSH